MRVLITGSTGGIGRAVVERLAAEGHDLRTFDRAARPKGQEWPHAAGDLRDIYAVRTAVEGVDAVAHLAAISHDRGGAADEVLGVNVLGTLNVLLAAAEAGVERVVFFSSVNALGNFQGHRTTSRFPIDDDYPHHPLSPYQLSKHLGEEACRSFSDTHGMTTISLRPVYVARPENYSQWAAADDAMWRDRLRGDYWSYVDLRDVCEATQLALTVQGVRSDAFLLCARDTIMTTATADLIDRYYPAVPWTVNRAAWLAENPHRSLLDCSHAEHVLGWRAAHTWRAGATGEAT